MKHLSLLLTVLMLGAVPLTAAALDYGPNQPMLAAENGAPQLLDAQGRAASLGAMPKPDVAEARDDNAPGPSTVTPQATPAPSPPVEAPPSHRSSASNKPRSRRTTKPVTAPNPASWQSLLPGSIQ